MAQIVETYKQVQQNFRQQIRRRQLNLLRQQHRDEYRKKANQEYLAEIYMQLETWQKKQNWVNQMALQLSGQPNQNWGSLLKKIYFASPVFKGQHEMWVNSGIIYQISLLIKMQYRQLQLMKLATIILNDILVVNKGIQHISVFKTIGNLQIHQELSALMIETGEIEYLRLVGSIFNKWPSVRQRYIECGCLDYLIERLNQLLKNEQFMSESVYLLFYMMKGLLKVLEIDQDVIERPKKSTIVLLLPIIAKLIQQNHTALNLSMLLSSLENICLLKKKQAYDEIAKYPILIDKSLQMICYESRYDVRLKSANFIMNYLLNNNDWHFSQVIKKGILDKIYQSYQISNNKQKIIVFLINIANNFFYGSQQRFQMLLKHPFLKQVVYKQMSRTLISQQSAVNEAIYCVCSLFEYAKGEHTQILLNIGFMDLMIEKLKSAQIQQKTIQDIFETIMKMVRNQSEEQRVSFIQVLINRFSIKQVVDELQHQIANTDILHFFSQFLAQY